jgi:hypothetical protein
MKRKYKATEPNCGGIYSKEEAEFFAKELKTTPENILVIYDATDEDGEWLEEIWDEEDAGFPARDGDEKEVTLSDYFLVYWEINVPGIGKGILVENASPIGIAFKKDELLKSNYKVKIKNE